jgi:hypothetical protein
MHKAFLLSAWNRIVCSIEIRNKRTVVACEELLYEVRLPSLSETKNHVAPVGHNPHTLLKSMYANLRFVDVNHWTLQYATEHNFSVFAYSSERRSKHHLILHGAISVGGASWIRSDGIKILFVRHRTVAEIRAEQDAKDLGDEELSLSHRPLNAVAASGRLIVLSTLSCSP